MGMNDLIEIKQAAVSYDLHSAFVRKNIETWTSSIKTTPHD